MKRNRKMCLGSMKMTMSSSEVPSQRGLSCYNAICALSGVSDVYGVFLAKYEAAGMCLLQQEISDTGPLITRLRAILMTS